MTALWLAAGAMALAVGVALAWPLIRRGGDEPSRTAYDVRVFKDQLDEVERDRTRGLLDEREAQAARTEIERRLLAASEMDSAQTERPAPGGRITAIIVGAAVPLAALALYLTLGQPQAPDQPYAARDLEREQRLARGGGAGESAPGITEAIAQLERRLEERPDDLRGWLLLARSYQATGDSQGAARAWRRAMEISGGNPEIATSYVEAATLANGGEIPDEARGMLPKIVADDPVNLKARYFQGLAQAQQGELEQALQTWVDLRAMSPEGAPWLEVVDSQIARAAEDSDTDPATIQPSEEAKQLAERVAEEAAAQPQSPAAPSSGPAAAPPLSEEQRRAVQEMSPEKRQQMIRGMVDRLAQRLEENPDDLEGWQRLARAYEVLGETEKAAEARMRLEMLKRQAQ